MSLLCMVMMAMTRRSSTRMMTMPVILSIGIQAVSAQVVSALEVCVERMVLFWLGTIL